MAYTLRYMAKVINYKTKPTEELRAILIKSFQSGNLNFLLGSGASTPAISVGGDVEKTIQELVDAGKQDEATKKMYVFLSTLQEPNNQLIADKIPSGSPVEKTLKSYERFLSVVVSLPGFSVHLVPKPHSAGFYFFSSSSYSDGVLNPIEV